MNVITNQKPIIELKGFKGLYARGAYDNCPPDHFTDCMNCIFPGPDQVTIREPITVSSNIPTRAIVSYFISTPAGLGARLMTLDATGQFHDDTTGVLLGTFETADDFSAINLFGRTYFSFKSQNKALSGSVLYYYDGVDFRPAAGLGPSAGPVLAQVNPGNVGIGDHKVAVSFQSSTGYLSPPSPLTTITSTGTNDIEISAIPLGPPGTVARVILATKANLDELFFVPLAIIPDNTTTILAINFFDTELLSSADYLNDLLTAIPAGSSLKFYKGRLAVIGQDVRPDILIISGISDPESFNRVTGIINFPVDYGINTCNTGLVIRDIFYVLKPNATYSTQDNGLDPSTWAVTVIDSGLGAWDTGTSLFASSLSAQDVFDCCFIANKRGLMLFDGTYNSVIPLTQKIESLWNLIHVDYLWRVQVAHDAWAKRVYIAIPLSPPITGNPFTFSTLHYRQVILMMDYQEGLDPRSVKWSTWSSPAFSIIGIFKLSFENFTLSYANYPIYQLTFCAGDNNIYKIIIFNQVQTITAPYIPDLGGYTINQYIITAPVNPAGDGVYFWTMLNFSLYGYGTVQLKVLSKNRAITVGLRPFNLSAYGDIDLQRLINFVSESIQVFMQCDQTKPSGNNGFFQLNAIDIYGKKMWAMRPALTETF